MPTTDKARNVLSDQSSAAVSWSRSNARRRVRYEDEDDDKDEDEYGHNEELARLELYSQTARGEALLVHALVHDEEVEVLIFKVTPNIASLISYSYLRQNKRILIS